MEIHENFSLKELNTFGFDVLSAQFCRLENMADIAEFIDVQKDVESTMILGGGSNVLFTKNFKGLIAKNEIFGVEILDKSDSHVWVKAGGGMSWHDLVMNCIDKGFGGIENLSLIPGTVGAAPMQNIGAYGVELKDVFVELEAFNRLTGKIETFDNTDCRFSYRESIFKTTARNEYIISSVTLRLTVGDHDLNTDYGVIRQVLKDHGIKRPTIKDISSAVISIRKSKLPDPSEIGNAGSFFKNPVIDIVDFEALKLEFPDIQSYSDKPGHVKVPAGWLIEKCGWKGKRIGDIGVHKNQALVLVNYGNGNGTDLLNLAEEIQKSVADTYGIELQFEVNIIGGK